MNKWDYLRLGLRAKYAVTGEYSQTDKALTWLAPRSPVSAAMAIARVGANKAKQTGLAKDVSVDNEDVFDDEDTIGL